MHENITKALNWRYATYHFDTSKKLSNEDLHTILDAARLAPSSFGIEAWKFLVVENPELRNAIREVGYGQPKIADASHLVVICRRTDVRENIANELVDRKVKILGKTAADFATMHGMLSGSIAAKDDITLAHWAAAQTYIALGMMIETAALLGVDAGPMEGFSPAKVDEILGLKEKNLASVTLLAIGHRAPAEEGAGTKVRRSFEEVVAFIK